jgi:two-component system, OmpR family, sensor kinase
VRVAAAAAVAIGLATILLGAAVVIVASSQLDASLDQALRDDATQVARLNASAPALLTAPDALEGQVGARRLLVEVVDRASRIVARSPSLAGQVLDPGGLLTAALRLGRSGFADTSLGDEPLRVFVAPLADVGSSPASGGAVLVAASRQTDRETIRRLRVVVVGAGILAALSAAAAATALTRRALRPVTRLSDAAAQIERTGDMRRRLPVPGTADELDALARTLNEMLDALQQAREAERRFVADASHELRTPLTALRGNAAYVAAHGPEPAALADLEADAQRLATLVDDLLALAREDAAAAPQGVVALVETARRVAERHPTAQLLAAAPVAVRGDEAALERSLENLVRNAEMYGPGGGAITIRVEATNGEARVSVTDQGQGLVGADAEHAFERFWRRDATSQRQGSGLGLAIVRATSERHGGSVRVDAATFTISLPLLTDSSDTSATPPVSPLGEHS